jgi:hypothetical protein
LQILFWTIFSIVAGTWIVFMYWRLRSNRIRKQHGEAPLRSSRELIWRETRALTPEEISDGPCGRGGGPAEPFHFVEEHDTGSQPCVSIRDARGREWRVKWGQEVHTEVFGTRLAWVLGYFAEPSYFIASGVIHDTRDLRRAKECIDERGDFRDARFELSESGVTKHFDAHGWAWHDNPFVGSHELNGLKILMMLVSNWDNKDVRDVARGSNTAIFEHRVGTHELEARYLIIDWGAALGAWGNNVLKRGRWDPEAFAEQNPYFITGASEGRVQFGYQGQRTADLVENITIEDMRWFDQRARAITDEHLRAMLIASGATTKDADAFTPALRERLDQIHHVATQAEASVA